MQEISHEQKYGTRRAIGSMAPCWKNSRSTNSFTDAAYNTTPHFMKSNVLARVIEGCEPLKIENWPQPLPQPDFESQTVCLCAQLKPLQRAVRNLRHLYLVFLSTGAARRYWRQIVRNLCSCIGVNSASPTISRANFRSRGVAPIARPRQSPRPGQGSFC